MSPLLDALLTLLADWRQVFQQQRSFARALRLSLAQILTPGQRSLSRLIASSGHQDRDWTADYQAIPGDGPRLQMESSGDRLAKPWSMFQDKIRGS